MPSNGKLGEGGFSVDTEVFRRVDCPAELATAVFDVALAIV